MHPFTKPLKWLAAATLLALLSGCAGDADLADPPVALGDFKLGHNIAVARNPTVGPLSRKATEEEWQKYMTEAIDRRFGRYDGEKLYHLGISVDGYVIAAPGIPVVASPKSVLIFTVTAWDDAAGAKLNEEAKQLTVLESFSGETVIGSGLTQTKEEQMANLSASAARAVQKWLLENPAWFGIEN